MAGIVLNILNFQIKVRIRSSEFLLMGMFSDTHFALQKSTNPQSKQCGLQEIFTKVCGTVDVWITVSLPTFFPVMWRVKVLQKGLKIARLLAVYLVKRWKTWKTMAVPKFKVLLMKKRGSARVTQIKTTIHCAECKARLFGNRIMHHLKILILYDQT